MTFVKSKSIFIFFSFGIFLGAFGGPLAKAALLARLTLDQAEMEAGKNSPKIASLRAAADGASWKRVEGLSGFLPSVSIQAQRLLDYKYQVFDVNLGASALSFPQIIPNTSYALNAYLPIFDGFANVRHYRASQNIENSAQSDLNWAEFQLKQEIKLKFYQAMAAVKLSEVAKQNVKTLEEHLQKTQVQRRGGVSTQFDVLRIEVQLSDAKADEIQAQDNVEISRKILAEAMGTENNEFEVVGELPAPEIGLVAHLQMPKPETRSDVQSLLAKDQATYEVSKIADNYYFPKIGLNYQYFYYNNRDNSFLDNTPYRNAWQLGVTLTWNLFDGMASIAKSHEVDDEYIRSQKGVRQALLHIPVDFENWKKRFSTASVNYKSKTLNVSKAQESVRLAHEGYRAGTRTNSEVLDAELDLFRARAGVVATQLGAEEALINLESVLGRTIASGN
jgi:outer membrane protein TolC